jgi:hypothetical protein
MATTAQIEANRCNALRSTGPTSEAGKAASSQNARKHGLAGSVLTKPEADLDALEVAKAKWRPELRPRGADEEALFEVVVAESIRIERCHTLYMSLCDDHGHRARVQWDADRRREADDLALKLASASQAVARQLERTKQGAELKLELWRGLASSLEKHATWTDAQRSLALDLLGVHPQLRDSETPVDPAVGDALAARRAQIASETSRLESLRDGALTDRDARERASAKATIGAELTKPLQLLHRYETAATNRQRAAWRALDRARESREGSPAPAPRKSSTPSVVSLLKALPARLREPEPEPEPAVADPLPLPATMPPVPHMNRRQRRALAARARQLAR